MTGSYTAVILVLLASFAAPTVPTALLGRTASTAPTGPTAAAAAAAAATPGAVATVIAAAEAVRRSDCDDGPSLAADSDLYCIELVPTPAVPGASGTVRLEQPSSPFTVAVSRDGEHRYELVIDVGGLPEPAALGDEYTTYVAWATTPLLRPMVRLGEVGRAAGALRATVALNKFIVMISAERSAEVEDRTGPLVLRGASASMRMIPHDVPFLFNPPGGAGRGGVADSAAGPDSAAAHSPAAGRPDTAWTPPPMHPNVQMPPAMRGIEPSVSPFLPTAEDAVIPAARPREVVPLADGDTLALEAGLVRRTSDGRTFTMYGFNGQYPGPLIRVEQGSTIVVDFTNRIGLPTAVHWHGVRLDNRFDGVPGVTQEAVAPGESFVYEVYFRDAGIYWYHPHHREDIQQDLGLYGNMLVRSPDPDYFGPANREEILMLDDLLIGDAGLVPYGAEAATHALMGRFGNVMLVNGEPGYELEVDRGAVVRFYLTNVSNTRTWNLSIAADAGAVPLKVVGGDIGRFEREEWVENVVIAPAERYVVEALFDEPGEYAVENRVQSIDHVYGNFFTEVDTLGTVRVGESLAEPNHAFAFRRLRENADVVADIARYREEFDRPVDHTLVLEMQAGDLPFPMLPLMRLDSAYFNPVEWSGTMPMMNWAGTAEDVRWLLRDPATGAENTEIEWRFRVGDIVKLRLVNLRRSLHAMHHPIHIHGQRFLVLSQNGVANPNLVWKDSILLPVGHTVDLLLELSNPGDWMLHCHIAEHLEAGMKMVFHVAADGATR